MSEDQESYPLYLFKYYSPRLIENIFVDWTIRFTPVDEFNDPFEALAGFNEEYKYYVKRDENKFDPVNDKTAESENFRQCVFGDIGIFCLSESADNIAMWSHYADSHKGFVVKLNMNCDFFKNISTHGPLPLMRIEYGKDRLNITDFQKEFKTEKSRGAVVDPRNKDLYKLLYNKSDVWKDEKEYRLFCDYQTCVKACEDKHIRYNKIGLHPLAKESVLEIILGCKMSTTDKKRIRHFLKYNPSTNHLPVKEAKLDYRNYKILIQ